MISQSYGTIDTPLKEDGGRRKWSSQRSGCWYLGALLLSIMGGILLLEYGFHINLMNLSTERPLASNKLQTSDKSVKVSDSSLNSDATVCSTSHCWWDIEDVTDASECTQEACDTYWEEEASANDCNHDYSEWEEDCDDTDDNECTESAYYNATTQTCTCDYEWTVCTTKTCFDANSMIKRVLPNLPANAEFEMVKLKDIKVGDLVASSDISGVFSRVTNIYHGMEEERDEKSEMVALCTQKTDDACVVLTPNHLIYINGISPSNLMAAKLAKEGDLLWNVELQAFEEIIEIKKNIKKQFRGILTENGNIVVNGILASNYIKFIGGNNGWFDEKSGMIDHYIGYYYFKLIVNPIDYYLDSQLATDATLVTFVGVSIISFLHLCVYVSVLFVSLLVVAKTLDGWNNVYTKKVV